MAARFAECFVGEVVISAISLAELECGVSCSEGKAARQNRAALDAFVDEIAVAPFDGSAASTQGPVRLATRQRTHDALDKLIAAHALALNATLVTNNVADLLPAVRAQCRTLATSGAGLHFCFFGESRLTQNRVCGLLPHQAGHPRREQIPLRSRKLQLSLDSRDEGTAGLQTSCEARGVLDRSCAALQSPMSPPASSPCWSPTAIRSSGQTAWCLQWKAPSPGSRMRWRVTPRGPCRR